MSQIETVETAIGKGGDLNYENEAHSSERNVNVSKRTSWMDSVIIRVLMSETGNARRGREKMSAAECDHNNVDPGAYC